MATVQLQTVLRFKTTTCISCGVIISIPEDLYDWRLKDHRSFYCPNGHSQQFVGETEEARLKRELDAVQRRLAFERTAKEQAEAALKKAQASQARLKKRVNCGVCPHCQRTFKQLAMHIQNKH